MQAKSSDGRPSISYPDTLPISAYITDQLWKSQKTVWNVEAPWAWSIQVFKHMVCTGKTKKRKRALTWCICFVAHMWLSTDFHHWNLELIRTVVYNRIISQRMNAIDAFFQLSSKKSYTLPLAKVLNLNISTTFEMFNDSSQHSWTDDSDQPSHRL